MADDKLMRIKLLAMDCDGVLTRGDITYTELGDESKVLNILDGLGLSIARRAGLVTAIVTGRRSEALARRARELGVAELYQGCRNKAAAMLELRARYRLQIDEVAFIGDDINDLLAFRECGFRIAVSNASEDVKAQADYITECSGGTGAVREVIERMLRGQGKWSAGVEAYLRELEQET